MEKDIIVFDLETKKEFAEVGGRENMKDLGVSVIGAYSYKKDAMAVFEEKEISNFVNLMRGAGLVVGFNIKYFDLPVLQPYVQEDLRTFPVLDLMDEVVERVGFRVSLDNLSQTTLGFSKIAEGLQAVRWYREGKMEKIKEYCLEDVRITKELYEYGKKNGHVLYKSREAGRTAIPIFSWNLNFSNSKTVRDVLEEALSKRQSVELKYVTRTSANPADESLCNSRVVDIFKVEKDFFEGYCHLRRANRVFKMDRVLGARILDSAYQLPDDVQNKILF